MAIAMFSVRVGSVGKAKPHFNYIAGMGHYKSRQKEILHTSFGNLPHYFDDIKQYWQLADENERINGSTYREHIISLPREFNLEQNIQFIEQWIEQELNNNLTYFYAIHNPKARDGLDQPHCHLMFSERIKDNLDRNPKQHFRRHNPKNPSLGGAKKTNTNLTHTQRKLLLKQQRQRFGDLLNQHLLNNGYEASIDMRNWQERGLEEAPVNVPMYVIKSQQQIEQVHAQRALKQHQEQLRQQKAEQKQKQRQQKQEAKRQAEALKRQQQALEEEQRQQQELQARLLAKQQQEQQQALAQRQAQLKAEQDKEAKRLEALALEEERLREEKERAEKEVAGYSVPKLF